MPGIRSGWVGRDHRSLQRRTQLCHRLRRGLGQHSVLHGLGGGFGEAEGGVVDGVDLGYVQLSGVPRGEGGGEHLLES